MLSLLCGSPDVVDSPFYDTQSRRSRSRRSIRSVLSRSGSGSSKKKRILKGSIGAPTDFRHEAHVGGDNMMAPTGAWDLDQWRAELEKYMQPQPVDARPVAEPIPEPPSPTTSSVAAPRRKPVPSLLPLRHDHNSPLSSVSSSPTRTAPIDDAVALV